MIKRLHWVDVAKCFGIFAIYLGHCGVAAGNAYEFVFSHHVPLFFLLSGCMESKSEIEPVHKVAAKVLKQILLPWLVCCILSMITSALLFNDQLGTMKNMLLAVAKGTIRNSFIAGSLWFLPCLTVMKILFSVIRRLKNKPLILLTCVAIFWVTQYVLPKNPLEQPSWAFNIDSALYYLIYYAIGYVGFPLICSALEPKTQLGKVFLAVSGIAAFGYSALLFFGKNLFGFVNNLPYIGAFEPVLKALCVIWLYFILAHMCQNVVIFQSIGRNTLYLCGGEFVANSIFQQLLGALGLGLNLITPMAAVCYISVVLVLANRFFVPVGKQLVGAVLAIPGYLKGKQDV